MAEHMTKLCLGADHYAEISPVLARAYMNSVEENKKNSGLERTSPMVLCPYCQQVFRPGNHKLTVLPRMRLTRKIKQLQKKSNQHGTNSLGKFQKSLLAHYQSDYNFINVYCMSCGMKTKSALFPRPAKVKRQAENVEENSKKLKKRHKKRSKQNAEKQCIPAVPRSPSMKSPASLEICPRKSSSSPKIVKQHTASDGVTSFKSLSMVMSEGKKSKHKSAKHSFSKLQLMLDQEKSSGKKKGSSLATFLESL